MIGLLEAAALAGTLLALAAWTGVVALAPRGYAAPKISPARRALVARAWLYAPLWVPALLVGAAFVPGLLGALVGSGDHCLAHGGHNHHLCLLHPPHASLSALGWLLPLALLLPSLALLFVCARRVWREGRLTHALVGLGRPADELGPEVLLLDQDEPVAVTVGWLRAKILLSTGLIERLSEPALEVVLAHERAHIARKDTWLALVDRLAASLLPGAAALPLLASIALAREQACDAAAAKSAGGPLEVARAVAEVARHGLLVPATGVSVVSGAVEPRVEYLLGAPKHGRAWVLALPAALLALVAAGAGPVHTAVEHLITYLLH